MTYSPTHAKPESTDELAYDPYAKVVVNDHQPVYSGVTPLVLEAHEVTSIRNNGKAWLNRINKLDNQIDNIRDYLVENYDELDSHADEIAKILGISLSKTVEVEVNVTFTATLDLEVGKDVDDLSEWDFDFSISESSTDFEISDYGSDVIYIRES